MDARILYLSLLTDGISSNLSKLHCLISLSGKIALWTGKVNSSVILGLTEACHIYVRKDLGVQITVSEKGEPAGCHICHPALRLGSLCTRDLSLHRVGCHKEPCWQQLKFSELLNKCLHRSRCPRRRSTQKGVGKVPSIALKNSSLENMLSENSMKSESQFCFFLLQTLLQQEYKNAFLQHNSESYCAGGNFSTYGNIYLPLIRKESMEKRIWLWDELKY